LLEVFSDVEKGIDDSLGLLEGVAAVRDTETAISRLSLEQSTPLSFRDAAQLPCFILPPARGSRFLDRDDVIEEIERHFHAGEGGLRSIALYGIGGVGKSQVALKYAEKKQLAKALDSVLWIEAETQISLQNSFTNAALRLKLPGTQQNTPNENHRAVLEWLKYTGPSTIVEFMAPG